MFEDSALHVLSILDQLQRHGQVASPVAARETRKASSSSAVQVCGDRWDSWSMRTTVNVCVCVSLILYLSVASQTHPEGITPALGRTGVRVWQGTLAMRWKFHEFVAPQPWPVGNLPVCQRPALGQLSCGTFAGALQQFPWTTCLTTCYHWGPEGPVHTWGILRYVNMC